MLDFGTFEAITFDTYGTLIDWETGILAAFLPALRARGIAAVDDDLLERYGSPGGRPGSRRLPPLRRGPRPGVRRRLRRAGFSPAAAEVAAFSASVGDWPAFADSAAALGVLKRRFGLGVITNCDDGLFALSNARLGVEFDWVVTAEQARSYKPSRRNFDLALTRIGLPRERILHVAQSLFHDHVPAKGLGLSTVWVDRRRGRDGPGATPPAAAIPDLVVPDLAALAELASAGWTPPGPPEPRTPS